jgi:hypothetical protein
MAHHVGMDPARAGRHADLHAVFVITTTLPPWCVCRWCHLPFVACALHEKTCHFNPANRPPEPDPAAQDKFTQATSSGDLE